MADFNAVVAQRALDEIASSYNSPAERAAYRAGLSTAAGLCDVEAAAMGRKNQRARAVNAALKRCGDLITELWERIDVTPSTDTPINDGNGGAERDAKVTACKCSPEDVHNYGPCDESCSSLTVFRHGGADV
jgi:hypothetical protein